MLKIYIPLPKVRKGYYEARFFCRACEKQLTWRQKMESHGVCPLCGTQSGQNIVTCETRSFFVEYQPWWKFWK